MFLHRTTPLLFGMHIFNLTRQINIKIIIYLFFVVLLLAVCVCLSELSVPAIRFLLNLLNQKQISSVTNCFGDSAGNWRMI